jgi:TM2 domain-containing membrane protein YozV
MNETTNAAADPIHAAPPPPPPQYAAPAQPQPTHYAPAAMSDPRQKSPFLAGLLSFMPGLGQIYVGFYQRGFVHAMVIAVIISLLASGELGGLTPLAAVFMAFFWLYNVIDASRRAALYNQALAGVGDVELPEDWKVPGFRGSVLGGLLIAGFGFLLLMDTLFEISMEWVEDWWPAGIIAFGLYLVYKAIDDKRKRESAALED